MMSGCISYQMEMYVAGNGKCWPGYNETCPQGPRLDLESCSGTTEPGNGMPMGGLRMVLLNRIWGGSEPKFCVNMEKKKIL